MVRMAGRTAVLNLILALIRSFPPGPPKGAVFCG